MQNFLKQRENPLKLTQNKPLKTKNPFFGVGPITNLALDEKDARDIESEFKKWLEHNYPKYNDKNMRLGSITVAEIDRSMHRGYPADKIILDMMSEIHRYFCLSETKPYGSWTWWRTYGLYRSYYASFKFSR